MKAFIVVVRLTWYQGDVNDQTNNFPLYFTGGRKLLDENYYSVPIICKSSSIGKYFSVTKPNTNYSWREQH